MSLPQVAKDQSNSFSAVWSWKSNPPVVHAYPSIMFNSSLLPLKLSDLVSLEVDLAWMLAPTSLIPGASEDPDEQPDADALSALHLQANVVIDMFGDSNAELSQESSKQEYEFMIWLGQFGDAAQAIGQSQEQGAPITETVGGVEL